MNGPRYWIRVQIPTWGLTRHTGPRKTWWYFNKRRWVQVRNQLRRQGCWYAAGRLP